MRRNLLMISFFAAVFSLSISGVFATAFSSPTLGGPTGIITVPTAQIGWDGNEAALDVGYHYTKDQNSETSQTLKANVSLFRALELSLCDDVQSSKTNGLVPINNDDLLLGVKFRFYPMRTSGRSSLAIGGKYMDMNYKEKKDSNYQAKQVYLAATYSGDFFSMPAETTLFFGKTWGIKNYQGHNDDWDFGMGFDLDLFPSLFKGYIHWINDFANFSYSPEAVGADAWNRGAFNTGVRIAVLKDYNRFKLNVDALYLDVLDHNRSWSFGITGGISF